MLSRVAESLFWMSRYFERAENTARFLEVNFNLQLDLRLIAPMEGASCWKAPVLALADPELFESLHEEYNAETVTEHLVFSRSNPSSIFSCIAMARENARSIIETISSEMWEQVNDLYHYLQSIKPHKLQSDPYSFYRQIKSNSHLFQGITDNTFSRTEGWHFIQLGKYLERADNAARLIDVKFHMLKPVDGPAHDPVYNSVDIIQWMAVLKSCSALEAFRKVYLSKIKPDNILGFLVLERTFPRSIAFSVCSAQNALWAISGSTRNKYVNNVDRLIGRMESELSYSSVEDMHKEGLHAYFEAFEGRLATIGAEIHDLYFAYHSPVFSQMASTDAMPFTGLAGGRAGWSQSQQQQ